MTMGYIKPRKYRLHSLVLGTLFVLAITLMGSGFALAAEDKTSPCDNVPHADHPKARLKNGDLDAVVFLPDPEKGYYRASRFDWSGVVGCLSYKGHTFWGKWFSDYDPLLNDAITGPVEEFRSEEGALGYADAKPGDSFVKVGVGVLRRLDSTPYKWGITYPLIDGGKWTTHVHPHVIVFQQKLQSPLGIAYVYTKTLRVEKGGVVTLEHRLKNIGTKKIETDVYDHDFFVLDGRITGKGIVVRFPFEPRVDQPFDESLAKIEGKEIVYTGDLKPKTMVGGYITGYSKNVSDYDILVEDHTNGISVRQTGDTPISKFYFWSISTTVSPEAYIHLNVPPGKDQSWTIKYQFSADSK